MNLINKEHKKNKYIIDKIEEIEKTISDIEDRIYEESLIKEKNVLVESFLVFLVSFALVFLMIYINKYLSLLVGVLITILSLYVTNCIFLYKDKRKREKLLNSLVSDKLNLETFLETLPKKVDLLKNFDKSQKDKL